MFYKVGVDISNTKSMWNFLKEHFTYYTMNSWNRQRSIAHNVKLYNLALEGDWTVAMRYLFDDGDAGCLQMFIDDEIRDFEDKYPYYEVAQNGRSGGYLVIYEKHGHGSILPECVADYDTYEDFKEDVKSGWNNWNVKDFNRELRDAVEIVREFDKLCDRLRDIVNEYSMRSFDIDKLEATLERFNNEYGDDLICLELTGPVLEECMTGGRIKLNDIAHYNSFMNCLFECFGDDRRRVTYNSTHLWLKES